MRKVQFTETVLRDANQSLIATRLPYSCLLYTSCWAGA